MTAPKDLMDYPDDVLEEGLDDLRVVRMALMSEGFDHTEVLSVAVVVSRAIRTLERLKPILDAGALSTYDRSVPSDKLVIPRYVP